MSRKLSKYDLNAISWLMTMVIALSTKETSVKDGIKLLRECLDLWEAEKLEEAQATQRQ
tara:strand:+ start:213 stop:389 length:177 start_codon:yes stop_codon:yes gene_type:complete